MNKEIAIIDTGYTDYEYEEKLFAGKGYALKIYKGDQYNRIEKARFASGASGIMVRGTIIASEFLDITREVKAIVRYGVGYDNIDLAEASKRRIKVANVQGYANHSVSDHAVALMFSCIRSLPEGSSRIREIFARPPVPDIFELHDKTAGIIGLGRIGSCFALKIRSLFKKVLAYDPYVPDSKFIQYGVEKTDLPGLLERSHVISLHCNLTPETKYIINKAEFGMMKNRPVLINTARGPVVNQDALVKALNENIIHSAGIDVFENEPPEESQEPLLTHPRAIVTGHYAWYSDYSMKALQRRAADNMIGLLTGITVEDQLNKI